jgi:hypothetical protein
MASFLRSATADGLIGKGMLQLVAALALAVPPVAKFPPVGEGDINDVDMISLTATVRDALAASPAFGERGRSAEIPFAVATDVCGDSSLDLIVIARVAPGDAGVSGSVRVVLRTQGNKFVVDDVGAGEDVTSMTYVGRRLVQGDKSPTAFVSVKRTSEGGSAMQELWGFGAPKGKASLVYRVSMSQAGDAACTRTFGCWAKTSKGDVLLLRGRGVCTGPEHPLHAELPKNAATRSSLIVISTFTDMDEASRQYRLLHLIPPEGSSERPFVTTNGNFQFTLDSPLPRCDELLAVLPANYFPGVRGPFVLASGPFLDPKAAAATLKRLKETDTGADAQIKEVPLAH